MRVETESNHFEMTSCDGSSVGLSMDGSMQSDMLLGGSSSQLQHRAGNVNEERRKVKRMAEEETRKVTIWRRNAFIVLGLTAVFVSVVTYIFLHRAETSEFETEFEQIASTIHESTQFNLKGLLESTNGLAQVLTSEAIKTNSQWPFMTLSSFEVFVRNTRAVGSSELIVVAPFVSAENIDPWNDYSTEHQDWIDESFQEYTTGRMDLNPIPTSVYRFGRFKGRTVLKPEDGEDVYPAAPFWTMSRPPFDTSIVNFNSLSEEAYRQSYNAMMNTRHWVMGVAGPNTLIDYTISVDQHDELHSASEVNNVNKTGFANDHPHTALVYPVFRDKDPSQPTGNDINSPIVAMIVNIIPWDKYLKRLLPEGVNGVYAVLHNSAGQSFTYLISGAEATYLGAEDLHDTSYDKHEYRIDFASFLGSAASVVEPNATSQFYYDKDYGNDDDDYGNLEYWFSIYPSDELKSTYNSNTDIIFTCVVAAIFVFVFVTFVLYDRYVTRKNNKILDAATHSNAILATLFPSNVKDRLLEDKAQEAKDEEDARRRRPAAFRGNNRGDLDASLENFFNAEHDDHEDGDEQEILKSKPIADLFPNATVLFADLVGFTAWSSTREPTEVFTLLETLYRNFDIIAKRKRVYKVETIGDCYVAVTGCPEPRKDHHVAMCRFAKECLAKMRQLTRKLEPILGPDTSTLQLRTGIHSGPVTGGVLRGERSRFQLFGDTMNTAARMESNSLPGRIHLSMATRDLLVASGKGRWVTEREDKIVAKGKGEMTTFWLGKTAGSATASSSGGSESAWSESTDDTTEDEFENLNELQIDGVEGVLHLTEKTQRVVEWTTQSLMALLDRLASARGDSPIIDLPPVSSENRGLPLDAMQEVISFPALPTRQEILTEVMISQKVENQLEMFVGTIASLYPRNNTFHNFEHACHVTQSVLNSFSRMQKENKAAGTSGDDDDVDRSFCVASDPLVALGCAFAALIHDVEHPGVPNARLGVENPALAVKYKGRSIAEQNSFDIAWDLLSESRFAELRSHIYNTEAEEARFRHLVTNAVMATDLFDKQLSEWRDDRWEKAFGAKTTHEESPMQVMERKATILIDLVIQAADIAHTMQHWDIYRKWNENLFDEMYRAYLDGRSDKDPSEGWFHGELWFFDNHVIPLARKLQGFQCIGVTADEFVSHAEQNRQEWEEKGREIVDEMLVKNGGEEIGKKEMPQSKAAESPLVKRPKPRTLSGPPPVSAEEQQRQAAIMPSKRDGTVFRYIEAIESSREIFRDEIDV